MNRCEIVFVCMNGLKDCDFAEYIQGATGHCTFMGDKLNGFRCGNLDARRGYQVIKEVKE